MSSQGFHSYKDRDRIQVLEKQVADLKLLTGQQRLTIGRLEGESISKSDRISSLLGADKRPARLTTSRQVRSASAAAFRPRASIQTVLETNTIKNKKIEQLTAEVEFWQRHFNLAEEKIAKLEKENSRLKSQNLQANSPLQKGLDGDGESIFLKKLLEENSVLKLRLETLQKSSPGVAVTEGKSWESEDGGDSGKENDPAVERREGRKVTTTTNSSRVTLKSKAPQKPVLRSSRPKSAGLVSQERARPAQGRVASQPSLASSQPPDQSQGLQHQVSQLSQHNRWVERSQLKLTNYNHLRCLQHQVCQLKADLERKASSYCGLAPPVPPPPPPPQHHQHHHHQPAKCCELGQFDSAHAHLCLQVQCLQRQVCHLKHELQHRGNLTQLITTLVITVLILQGRDLTVRPRRS